MKHTFSAAITSLALALPSLALAQNSGPGETVRMSIGNDLYTAGDRISIEESVAGDIAAAGGQVFILGSIEDDIAAAGGEVSIEGTVGGDVRTAGGNITVRGSVEGDAVLLGGAIHLMRNASVQGDVVIAGGDVTLDGTVNGNLRVYGGVIRLNGSVLGDVIVHGDNVHLTGIVGGDAVMSAQTITAGDAGRIEGNLSYWRGTGTPNIESFVGGTATIDPDLGDRFRRHDDGDAAGVVAAVFGAIGLYMILSAALVIGLLLFVTKTIFPDAAKRMQDAPGRSFLYGCLYFLLLPILAVLLFASVIGIPLGIAAIAMFGISLLFVKPVASIVIAQWMNRYWQQSWSTIVLFFVALGVYAALKLLMVIPVAGWLFCFIVTMTSFGALLIAKSKRIKKVL